MPPYYGDVAVVGAGTMGNGIAQTFAAHGSRVELCDVDQPALERGIGAIEKSLARFVKKDQLAEADARAILERITPTLGLGKGDAQLVVEAVVERREVKADVFASLDRLCAPATILATNTSSISITEIGAATQRPDRVVGMHFMNPVPLMKLVEVIRGQETSDETSVAVTACAEALGKVAGRGPTTIRASSPTES